MIKKICVKLCRAGLVGVVMFMGFSANAATTTEEQIPTIEEKPAAEIPAEKKQIIDFNDIIENEGVVKEVYFLGDIVPPETLNIDKKELGEIIDDRTEYAQKFFNPEKKQYFLKIRQTPFFEKDGQWYEVNRATSTLKDWNAQARRNFWGINTADAATISPYATNDGYCSLDNDDGWSFVRSAASATDFETTSLVAASGYTAAPDWSISRSFLTFNTSALPDSGYKINTAAVYLRGTAKSGSAASALSGASNYGSLAANDYSKINDTVLSDTITYNNFSTAGFNTFNLNAAGTSSISLIGNSFFSWRNYTHDILNSAPVAVHSFTARSSAYTGTASDPYLVVSYSVIPTSTPAEITSATTTTNIFEIKKYTKNGTTYFYFPFFHVFFILLCLTLLIMAIKKPKK